MLTSLGIDDSSPDEWLSYEQADKLSNLGFLSYSFLTGEIQGTLNHEVGSPKYFFGHEMGNGADSEGAAIVAHVGASMLESCASWALIIAICCCCSLMRQPWEARTSCHS